MGKAADPTAYFADTLYRPAKPDAARKAAMRSTLFIGFSLLIGGFIAGVAAKIGGHHRDHLAA